jgi:HK97 family phage prohead protease
VNPPIKRGDATRTAQLKALGGDEGVFEAIVSVFGNTDHAGDRILPGAFAGSLARWRSAGRPIPVVWSHEWDKPEAHVGVVLEAEEWLPGDLRLPQSLRANGGLWVKGQFDLDRPLAADVWRLLSERRVFEWSFAYDILDRRRASDGATELLELDVIEVGPTLKGANPMTELLLTKSAVSPAAAKTLEKAIVTPLAGSAEERQEAVLAGALEWARANNVGAGGLYDVHLEATFPDRVVFRVEGWDDPYGGGTFWEAPLAGSTLGEPYPVEIEATTRRLSSRSVLTRKSYRPGAAPGVIRTLVEIDALELELG